MQADAYAGFSRLYETNRKGGPTVEAACWVHGRRKRRLRGCIQVWRGRNSSRCISQKP